MLKITEGEIAHELGRYLHRALSQAVVIEESDRDAVVVLSLSEYERLQEVDELHWAACARQANLEGYVDHDQEVRRRLAEAMRERGLAAKKISPA